MPSGMLAFKNTFRTTVPGAAGDDVARAERGGAAVAGCRRHRCGDDVARRPATCPPWTRLRGAAVSPPTTFTHQLHGDPAFAALRDSMGAELAQQRKLVEREGL